MIPLTNYDFQWARSELVIIYPDLYVVAQCCIRNAPEAMHEFALEAMHEARSETRILFWITVWLFNIAMV